MVYDCFTFFNELEILDIRLHELGSVVDKFVIVESAVTFRNRKKPLFFKDNKNKFKKFEDKIIHVIVEKSPNSKDPWEIERFQFNEIKKGLKEAKLNDIILLSCVDEIPKSEVLKEWINKSPRKTKVFEQKLYYYFLNFVRADNNYWKGTKMLSLASVKNYKDLYGIREADADIVISNGGWHFSYMGGVKRIQDKISSFSHTEFDNKNYNSIKNIKRAINEKNNIGNDFILFKIERIKNLPLYIQSNRQKFSSLLSKENPSLLNEVKIIIKKLIYRISKNG